MSNWLHMYSIGGADRRAYLVAELDKRGVGYALELNCGSEVVKVFDEDAAKAVEDIMGWTTPTPESMEAGRKVREELQRRVAMEWHLTSNFYPPIPGASLLVDAAIEAIDACNSGWDGEEIYLPDGMLVNDKPVMRASEVVDWLRLESLVSSPWDFEEEE